VKVQVTDGGLELSIPVTAQITNQQNTRDTLTAAISSTRVFIPFPLEATGSVPFSYVVVMAWKAGLGWTVE
jgi:hypothetical protein